MKEHRNNIHIGSTTREVLIIQGCPLKSELVGCDWSTGHSGLILIYHYGGSCVYLENGFVTMIDDADGNLKTGLKKQNTM